MQTTSELRPAAPLQHAHVLPSTGYLRINQIVGKRATKSSPAIPALIPVCKSTWWAGVKEGRYPKPIKLSDRVTVWRVEQILELIGQAAA